MKSKNHNISLISASILLAVTASTHVVAAPSSAPERATYEQHTFSATQKVGEKYPGFDQLAVYDANETYPNGGTKVKYTKGDKHGVFINSYWTKGSEPKFDYTQSDWKLLALTDKDGYQLDPESSVPTWNGNATYNGGDHVWHDIAGETYEFEAKYWTQGKAPVLTKAHGGIAEEWETDWIFVKKIGGTDVPETGKPDTGNPDEGKPDTGNPDTGNPDTGKPDTGNPDTGKPDTGNPDTGKPDTGKPDTGKPDTGNPDTGKPDTGNPDTEIPETETPETETPDATYPLWDATKVYLEGDEVSYSIDGKIYNFRAKYWTQGNEPILTKSYGGTVEDWDTAWQIFDADEVKPETGKPDIGNPNPDVENPEVKPPTVTGPDLELPDDGYEFLKDLKPEHWEWLFPLRSGKYNPAGSTRNMPPYALLDGSKDVFTLASFKQAVLEYNTWAKANNYKQFMNEGTRDQQAVEFVTFWAKSARETSGTWAGAPSPWIETDPIAGTVWKGALYWVEEMGRTTNDQGISPSQEYVDPASVYKPVPGRSYYGRGIIQLSWNYNYGQFSEWLYDNRMMRDVITAEDTLLQRPDYVANYSELAYLSGIWFWMTPQGVKPSSHDVMYGNVYNVSQHSHDPGLPPKMDGGPVPTAAGESSDEAVMAYRLGTVINIVNGGLECGGKVHDGPKQRVSYYNAYAKYINAKLLVNVPEVEAATNVWTTPISNSSAENLKNAACYSMKSYYTW